MIFVFLLVVGSTIELRLLDSFSGCKLQFCAFRLRVLFLTNMRTVSESSYRSHPLSKDVTQTRVRIKRVPKRSAVDGCPDMITVMQ